GTRADVCTDTDCFQAKAEAAREREAAAARARGQEVLSSAQTERLFQRYDNTLSYGSDYVDLRNRCHEDPKKRTYRQILGESANGDVVVAFDHAGKAHQLLPKSKAGALLKAQ